MWPHRIFGEAIWKRILRPFAGVLSAGWFPEVVAGIAEVFGKWLVTFGCNQSSTADQIAKVTQLGCPLVVKSSR